MPFVAVDEARGVLAPVRLTGPLHGVTFRTGLPKAQRATSPWEIVDCRLALALDDFAVQLAAHDVAQVIHFSVYRPPVVSWPAGKLASRHPGALAIDAGSFVKKDGTTLEVERDFHGHIGAVTCGAGAGPDKVTPQATELRRILCDAAAARLFNVVLTPDYNRPHHNHFHLEVTAGARWFVVRLRAAQLGEHRRHVVGQRQLPADEALGRRVDEAQLGRVQHQARRLDQRARVAAHVDLLADERVAGLAQVDADSGACAPSRGGRR